MSFRVHWTRRAKWSVRQRPFELVDTSRVLTTSNTITSSVELDTSVVFGAKNSCSLGRWFFIPCPLCFDIAVGVWPAKGRCRKRCCVSNKQYTQTSDRIRFPVVPHRCSVLSCDLNSPLRFSDVGKYTQAYGREEREREKEDLCSDTSADTDRRLHT